MKKVVSVVGARPNFMKIAPIDRAFKAYSDEIEHIIVHTGQHYDYQMSEAFFQDLQMPSPNFFLGVGSGSHAEQTAKVMTAFEEVCQKVKPDLVIVPGDVNSTMAAAITTKKLSLPLAHIEAGLRSGDRTMPEEINRIVTDVIADLLFVTEKSGYENLIAEGIPSYKIHFVGNTMIDSLIFASEQLNKSKILQTLQLSECSYVLITLHRPTNVDSAEMLSMFFDIFNYISSRKKIVFPVHPRTRKNITDFGLDEIAGQNKNLILTEPLGYIDFLNLMKNSSLVITDSGGIQEETTFLGVPCITTRTTTERPITVEIGTNTLVHPEKEAILKTIYEKIDNSSNPHQIPKLWDGKASKRIAEIIYNYLR
jgi:UDP-N-acetylglucosamine 2-epimerase (non-hydrolysing)